MKTMHSITEIPKALASALRMSESLPNDQDNSSGSLYILLDPDNKTVGYYVEKTGVEDAWESLDPRGFITPSFAAALELLATPFAELPARETVTA